MRFARPLLRGTLIRRYKRFLADVMLEDGREIVAHCANPGAMLGLVAPGLSVWLEPSNDSKRKLAFSWRLVEAGEDSGADGRAGLVGIDASLANRIVAEALAERRIPPLAAYTAIRPEVRYGARSRVDFLLTGRDLPDAYVEVKNVHFRRHPGRAEFPDSVTERGARHLVELGAMVAAGHRAVMLYLVQRADCDHLRLASDLDPAYARAFTAARAAGVEALAFTCRLTPETILLDRPISVEDLPATPPFG